jgi:glucose/arabinose dehydrogenase
MSRFIALILLGLSCSTIAGCYVMRPSAGGGQTSFSQPRQVDPSDVAVPEGYAVEVVATGLTFPTGVAFDEAGTPFVTESGYSYGEVWSQARLLELKPGEAPREVASGGKSGPWTGVTYRDGHFYIAEGDTLEGGRIIRVSPGGKIEKVVEGLPSLGDHHTNGPAFGPDGKLYFGQGTATNAGIVGGDNFEFGWLKRRPEFHDIPCRDIVLTGENVRTSNPLKPGEDATTGAFLPFGTASTPGQVVKGSIPCSGAVFRVDPKGGSPELVAWGFRNPFGLSFSPDGTLFVTDNMYDERGSRPIFGTGDLLWRVTEGGWHGWPDFHGDHRLDDGDRYGAPGKAAPKLLLAKHPGEPSRPAAQMGVHASADGFDFSRNPRFGHVGEAFIAEFGDQAPATGKTLAPVGFRVVRVDPRTGIINDFMTNIGKKDGPATHIGGNGLERPLAARFDPKGESLYVVDFGVMTMSGKQPRPQEKTGVLWRVYRKEGK